MQTNGKTELERHMEKAMGPDNSKQGLFVYHHCPVCQSGKYPCKQGGSLQCDNPIARND